MSITAFDAAQAYSSAIGRATGMAGGAGGVAGGTAAGIEGINAGLAPLANGDGFSFGQLIEQTVTQAIGTSKAAEQATAGAVTGTKDLVDVVTAVNNAEIALETVVAMRDRMISAYQEIMRMPI